MHGYSNIWKWRNPDELYHYGIKGMKWGVRRTKEQLAHDRYSIEARAARKFRKTFYTSNGVLVKGLSIHALDRTQDPTRQVTLEGLLDALQMADDSLNTSIASTIPSYAGVVFQVTDADGVLQEYSTRDFNLIPLNPIHIKAFDEKYETMEFPPYHGSPEKTPLKKRTFKNSSGTWDFYYVTDGSPHSSWDDYGRNAVDEVRERCGIPDKTKLSIQLYPDWSSREGDWTSTYFRLMRILQGRTCTVSLELGGTIFTAAKPKTYKGRCWVSNVKNGNDGRVTLTISYDLQPPDDLLS